MKLSAASLFALKSIIAGLCLAAPPLAVGGSGKPSIELTVAREGYDKKAPLSNSHLAVVPAENGQPETIVITLQPEVLTDSDNYLGLAMMKSRDGGRTWSDPVEQPVFHRTRLNGGVERSVCDYAIQWNAATHKLLGIGVATDYRGPKQVGFTPVYSVFDRVRDTWGPYQVLKFPDPERFRTAVAGNSEWISLPNGEILLAVYHQRTPGSTLMAKDPFSSSVVRCRFDGAHLEVIGLGNEMTVPYGRGFCEPSLIAFGGRYYLTLRNDWRQCVCVSEDGLHYSEPKPWLFDDGDDLGSYNTIARWMRLGHRLFFVYTRRGMNNDHVYRNRAPLVLGEVDPQRLCVLRASEQILVPDKGADVAAWLTVAQKGENESWICATEDMENGEKWGRTMLHKLDQILPDKEVTALAATTHMYGAVEQFGSNGRIYVVKVKLAP